MRCLLYKYRSWPIDDHNSFKPKQKLNTLSDMSRVVGEICVQRVEKIDAAQRKMTTEAANKLGAAGARARLGGIDAAAAEYIMRVHERLAAEEAARAATAAAN
jgi:hypothetical protein